MEKLDQKPSNHSNSKQKTREKGKSNTRADAIVHDKVDLMKYDNILNRNLVSEMWVALS